MKSIFAAVTLFFYLGGKSTFSSRRKRKKSRRSRTGQATENSTGSDRKGKKNPGTDE
jgi:hypothetical protein